MRVKVLFGGKCTWKVSWWSTTGGGVGETVEVEVVSVVAILALSSALMLLVWMIKRWRPFDLLL